MNYTITHTKTKARIATFETLKHAELTQRAYSLQDCCFISCVPLREKSLFEKIDTDFLFAIIRKVFFWGLPLLTAYALLNF